MDEVEMTSFITKVIKAKENVCIEDMLIGKIFYFSVYYFVYGHLNKILMHLILNLHLICLWEKLKWLYQK